MGGGEAQELFAQDMVVACLSWSYSMGRVMGMS